MRIWTALWFLAATVIGVFAAVNWQALAAPTIINLILWQVNAPLGLVMLSALLALTMFYFTFLLWLETRALVQLSGRSGSVDSTSSLIELRRDFVELRRDVERQLGELRVESSSLRSLVARMEHMEATVKPETFAH